MSIDIETKNAQGTLVRTGKVAAIAYSQELADKVRKDTHDEAQITHWGIPGDHHYGEMRYSQSRRATIPNERPITVCGAEATREVCERLGIPDVPPGGLGENLLLEGLGDLGDLGDGDELHIVSSSGEPGPVLRVSMQNPPCSNLQVYHRLMTKEMYGKRGVICTVLQEGNVRLGDTVQLVRR